MKTEIIKTPTLVIAVPVLIPHENSIILDNVLSNLSLWVGRNNRELSNFRTYVCVLVDFKGYPNCTDQQYEHDFHNILSVFSQRFSNLIFYKGQGSYGST